MITSGLLEKKMSHQYPQVGFHFGYYEKGVIKYKEAVQNMNDYAGRLLGLENGQSLKIFDAGCGIGATSIYLAKKYPACHFTGLSLGTEEIELAKKLQKEQNLKNMIFLSGNYTKTAFHDNSFDDAFAIESVVYALNKKDVVNEISRVLKPGGKFVIIDAFLTKDPPSNSFLQNAYMLDLQKRSIPGFISLQEIRMHLESAGFSDIVMHDLSKNIMWYYFFGGFFFGFRNLFSSEMKRLTHRWKIKSDEDADKIMLGADFVELLLGATKKIGYYAITAIKK